MQGLFMLGKTVVKELAEAKPGKYSVAGMDIDI